MKALLLVLAISLSACGDDAATGPDAQPATCADYCSAILTNCDGEETQYTNMDLCMSICETFPQGDPGAQTGNSLECRAYHAGAALGDATTHCVHAGPGGAGLCGANCEGFCQLVQDSCTGALEAYPSDEECIEACMDFDDTEKFDVGDVAGDTLACRLYHASVATADPDTHCGHTEPVSATCN